ncbi:prolipoprotein diacylglyceryl transferase [Algoriphagus terrigena]|uniref:prolipoprotein diacylglyceryl transferase n=1 Tax=Algoriphagus terrigena TaxID=344884 RepID=UPI0003F81127|nr:prolipoprotein diacylglyceryl transferase [Algoriphagus terrigena]
MAVLSELSPLLLSIRWDHDGSIWNLGFYDLRWYSVLFAAGFALSFFLLRKRFRDELVPEEKVDTLLVYILFATIFGARLGHCFFYELDYYSQHPIEILLPFHFSPQLEFTGFRGLASHGGAIGIVIAILAYSKIEKMNVYWVMDKLALAIPLACAFIRLGNLFNSEMVGHSTSVPWAVVFLQLDDVPRHPGQLYEAIAYFSIFLFLNLFYQKFKKQDGFIFGLFLVLMFSARFALEFFKIDQVSFESEMALNMGQLLSVPFILAGIYLMVRKVKSNEGPGVSIPERAS